MTFLPLRPLCLCVKYSYLLLCVLALLPLLLSGCTATMYRNQETRYLSGTIVETHTMRRLSLLQGVELSVTVWPDGTATLSQYRNDGGGKQAGTVIGTAAKAMVK
jgi:hypothetical protein